MGIREVWYLQRWHFCGAITIDVYGDNRGIIIDGVPEIEAYIEDVLPDVEKIEEFKKKLLEIVVEVADLLT